MWELLSDYHLVSMREAYLFSDSARFDLTIFLNWIYAKEKLRNEVLWS